MLSREKICRVSEYKIFASYQIQAESRITFNKEWQNSKLQMELSSLYVM